MYEALSYPVQTEPRRVLPVHNTKHRNMCIYKHTHIDIKESQPLPLLLIGGQNIHTGRVSEIKYYPGSQKWPLHY